MRESVDSKAYLVTFLMKIPYMILWGLTGAILGSGLYLLITAIQTRTPEYCYEKEYYIEFSYDKAKDYYNAYTWNDVLYMDPLLGKVMEKLPSEYNREDIKRMIDADVYSDVRYLTIKVHDQNKKLVETVSEELSLALQDFGRDMKEFQEIREMEQGSVLETSIDWFTWRVALLGLVIGLCFYIFVFSWKFSLGDSFYTRKDIERYLDIKACMLTEEIVQHATKINFSETNDFKDSYSSEMNMRELFSKVKDDVTDVLLLIPQGKSCRQEIEEFVITAKQENITICGAVLVDCSKKWLSWYGVKHITEIYHLKEK